MAIGALVAATLISAAPPASASTPPSTFCNGKSYQTVVKVYYRGAAAYPMRCGTTSWGFVHIQNGGHWTADTDASIAQVISRGYFDAGVWNFRTCPNFRVPYNGGALNGNGISPQGIITAYWASS